MKIDGLIFAARLADHENAVCTLFTAGLSNAGHRIPRRDKGYGNIGH